MQKVELAAARAPQGEWITEHKNLVATIHQQDVELQKKETKLQLMEGEIEKSTTRHKQLLLKIDHLGKLMKEAVFSTAAHSFSIILTRIIPHASWFLNKSIIILEKECDWYSSSLPLQLVLVVNVARGEGPRNT